MPYKVKRTSYLKVGIKRNGRTAYSSPIKILVNDSIDWDNLFGKHSDAPIDDAVNSLPLVYDDGLGDFETPPGGAPPSGVYDYPPIDGDRLYLGIHENRLYLKWALDGKIPTSIDSENGNTIESMGYNVMVSDQEQPDASNECGGSIIFMQVSIAYHDGQVWYNSWYKSDCNNTGPYNSMDEYGYANNGQGLVHSYRSGLGEDSIVISYPLSKLGISENDELKIQVWNEAESDLWDHYSFDDGNGWTDWTVAEV
jgi:hypothetical protein